VRCDRAKELISPFVDGELGGEDRKAVAAHIEACADCAALVRVLRTRRASASGAGSRPTSAIPLLMR
jgi:anti-sigma factor RsiW